MDRAPQLNPEHALMLNTLAYILYTPRLEVFKEVEAARARAKKADSSFHLTPQTGDEHLLSLWRAVVSSEEEQNLAAGAAGK
jgi:hypothetical protein